MAGQPAVAPTFFSFLPHFCHSERKPQDVVRMNPSEMDPGFLTATDVIRHQNAAGTGLQDIVNRMLERKKHLRKHRFSLVDLTTNLFVLPPFAGNEEKKQGGLGSMAKLAIMYAAFQLKFDLEQLAKQQGLQKEEEIFKAARSQWAETQKRDSNSPVTELHPGDQQARIPRIELRGSLVRVDGKAFPLPIPATAASPNLERIFKMTATGLQFQGSDRVFIDQPGAPHTSQGVEDYVHKTPENFTKIRQLSFAERMLLMVDESDNTASHTCVQDVGYLYIASSLFQSDLYNPKRGGGLWEGSSHRGLNWEKSFVIPAADFQNSTAAAFASLLTLIAQGRLVNPAASAAMKHLMSKKKTGLTVVSQGQARSVGSYTRSFLGEGLLPKGFRFKEFSSKIGIGDFVNDCALVLREDRGKELHYAVAAFDDNGDGKSIGELMVELDMCVQENNGLAPQ